MSITISKTRKTEHQNIIDDEKIKRNLFVIFCIEIYKNKHKLNGRQAAETLFNKGIYEYLQDCYGALHTCGNEYILNSIEKQLKTK